MTYIAKRTVKVSVGSASGNRIARIVQPGGVIPGGVEEEQLARLVERGLIEGVEEPEAASIGEASADEAPTKAWNHDRIDEWAASQQPPIVLVNPDPEKQFTKEQKLEQIAAELQKRSE